MKNETALNEYLYDLKLRKLHFHQKHLATAFYKLANSY